MDDSTVIARRVALAGAGGATLLSLLGCLGFCDGDSDDDDYDGSSSSNKKKKTKSKKTR